MANSIPFRTTSQLGPQLDDTFSGLPYWDKALGLSTAPTDLSASYKLGNVEMGNDGGEYFWVRASADIAATATTGTQVTLAFPAYTVAAGAGGFYTLPNTAVKNGDYCHVRRGAFNATPT